MSPCDIWDRKEEVSNTLFVLHVWQMEDEESDTDEPPIFYQTWIPWKWNPLLTAWKSYSWHCKNRIWRNRKTKIGWYQGIFQDSVGKAVQLKIRSIQKKELIDKMKWYRKIDYRIYQNQNWRWENYSQSSMVPSIGKNFKITEDTRNKTAVVLIVLPLGSWIFLTHKDMYWPHHASLTVT